MPDGGATNIAKLNIHPVSTPSYYLQRMEPLLPNAIQNPHPHSDGTESTTVRMSETSDEPAKQPPIRTTWNHGGDEATKNGKGRPFVKAPSHCYIIIAPSGHIVLCQNWTRTQWNGLAREQQRTTWPNDNYIPPTPPHPGERGISISFSLHITGQQFPLLGATSQDEEEKSQRHLVCALLRPRVQL